MLPFRDITGLEVEVKGVCIPLNVVLHPYAMFVSAPALVGSTIKRLFTVSMQSLTDFLFLFVLLVAQLRKCEFTDFALTFLFEIWGFPLTKLQLLSNCIK